MPPHRPREATFCTRNPCLDPFDFSETTQPAFIPATDKFTGSELAFTFAAFNIDPSVCEISYTCEEVSRQDGTASPISCSELTEAVAGDTKKFSITADSQEYSTMAKTPGAYDVTFKVAAVGSSPEQSFTVTKSFTLEDPCDPPVSLTKPSNPGFEDQVYTVTDTMASYTHPDFVIEPDFCPFTLAYQIDPTSGGIDVVTRNDKTFTFSYN